MVCYEILCDKKPFAQCRDMLSIVKSLAQDARPERLTDALAYERGLTDPVWKLITDCWDNRPEARPTMQSVAPAMRGFANRPKGLDSRGRSPNLAFWMLAHSDPYLAATSNIGVVGA